jgi:multimeric flavodoxin WrbA
MKVVAFNCSPRPNGNTAAALGLVLAELERRGAETQLIQVGGKPLRGCSGCQVCRQRQDHLCALPDDGLNGYIRAMLEADGILLGSPVYFSSMTSEAKALMDRTGYALRSSGQNLLRRKAGAAVTVARRAGANMTFAELNMFFLINEMIVPGSQYWNVATVREPGDLEKNAEAVACLTRLGENMAWLLEKTLP